MRTHVALGVAALGFLSLVTNRIPWVPIALFSLAAALGVRRPCGLSRGVLAICGWWAISFLLSAESAAVFFSFDFHRRDGQIFFSILPALTFVGLAPPAHRACLGLAAFCMVQALVSVAAFVADLTGARGSMAGILFLHDESPSWTHFCGLYLAHNAVGSVQALCCLAAAAMAMFRQGARERWFWGGLTIPLLWGVLLSGSRGALLALAGGLGALAFLALRNRIVTGRVLIGIGLVVTLTALAFVPSISKRFAAFAKEDGTHAWRIQQWKRALREWSLSPIVGEGLGRFNDQEREWSGVRHLYYVVTRAKVVNEPSHAHNSYVHFLAEGGLMGFGLTVGFWGWVAWKLRRSREPLRVAAFLGVVFLFLISFTEHYMGGGAMLLVLTSLVGAAWNLPDEPETGTIPAA